MKNSKLNISLVSDFGKVFRPYQIMEKAEQIGFAKRDDGKLSPITFVKAMTVGIANDVKATLEHITCKCEEIQTGLKITRQALYQRLEVGVELLKAMFELSLEYAYEKVNNINTIGVFTYFKNVYICDSTLLPVSKKLIDIFPSSGGNNDKGAIRLQTVFSIINRTFKKLEFFKGTNNDQEYAHKIAEMVAPGELVVFDLGYFGKAVLNKIKTKGAYFITRIAHTNSFYIEANNGEENVEKVDILEVLKKSNGIVDMEVVIGTKKNERLKCRLVAIKLPEQVVNERRRKAKIKNKVKVLTALHSEFLAWNIMITNVPKEVISLEAVYNIYRIRWQIEIIFKSLKSNLNLDKLGIGGKAQTQCILYGRLILIVLFTAVYSNMYALMYFIKNRELSILKFFDLFNSRHSSILQTISKKFVDLKVLLEIVFGIVEKSLYEKRKRKSTLELLMQYPYPSKLLPKAG